MEATGRIACSKAGRDKGRRFVVIGVFDEEHVLIVDGRLRKVTNPKKKKLRHLQFENQVIGELEEWLRGDMGVADANIRKCLMRAISGTQDTAP